MIIYKTYLVVCLNTFCIWDQIRHWIKESMRRKLAMKHSTAWQQRDCNPEMLKRHEKEHGGSI